MRIKAKKVLINLMRDNPSASEQELYDAMRLKFEESYFIRTQVFELWWRARFENLARSEEEKYRAGIQDTRRQEENVRLDENEAEQ